MAPVASPKPIIRAATAADADIIFNALLGIADALGERDRIVSSAYDIRLYGFGHAPAFAVLIAEIDKVFAGMCLSFPSFSTWFGRPGVYVQDLYVDPAFRKLGVAEALMRRLARQVLREGGTYIRLSVDADNPDAQRFYEKIGMKWSDKERIYVARHGDFERLAEGDGT
jgi:ribosomal protein S18 acetylase RimI-like enzyme